MSHVLYLSHDGALDPLGQSQILPYLQRLSRPPVAITLLTFEKPQCLRDRTTVQQLRRTLAQAGIAWVPLRYHRRPPVVSTLWDLCRGLVRALAIVRRQRVTLVHARGYVGAALAVILKRLTGVRVLFDMRELWVDGRVDGGRWRRGGCLHRLGKRAEQWCLLRSDAVVSLTEDGRRLIERFTYWTPPVPPITVIPTCVDVARFANHRVPVDRRPAELEGRRVIVYLGSLGSWYRLDAMVSGFREALAAWPDALFLLLTPQVELARRGCLAGGLAPEQVMARTVAHADVPRWLRWAEMSLYFIAPSFAKRSSCPTKLGESLAAGLPVLTNTGVGDTDALVASRRIGILVDAFSPAALQRGWSQMLELLAEGEALRERCRQTAQEVFGLEQGVGRYAALYRTLGAS
jgi:glycosyltransferase involved in cell wall biosynthesis